MGGPSGIMPANMMEKKGTIGSPMDQGNSGLPITINSQVAAPISNDDIAFGKFNKLIILYFQRVQCNVL